MHVVRSGTHFYLGTGWVPVARELGLEPGEQASRVSVIFICVWAVCGKRKPYMSSLICMTWEALQLSAQRGDLRKIKMVIKIDVTHKTQLRGRSSTAAWIGSNAQRGVADDDCVGTVAATVGSCRGCSQHASFQPKSCPKPQTARNACYRAAG